MKERKLQNLGQKLLVLAIKIFAARSQSAFGLDISSYHVND